MIGLTTRLGAFRLAFPFIAALLIAGSGRAETERIYRIGLLLNTHLADGINALIVEMRGLGYMEGRNLVLDWRLVDSAERNTVLAAELISLKPDILLAAGSQQVEALKRATASIPIVFVNTGDPVGLHLVDSLARPGILPALSPLLRAIAYRRYSHMHKMRERAATDHLQTLASQFRDVVRDTGDVVRS